MNFDNPYIGSGAGNDTTLALMHAGKAKISQAERDILDPRKLSQITEKAEEFEAMFIAEMLKPMFDGIKTDGLFGGGKTEEIFRSMMLDEYGKAIAKQNSIGIADIVKTELIKVQSMAPLQAGQSPAAPPQEVELDTEHTEHTEQSETPESQKEEEHHP